MNKNTIIKLIAVLAMCFLIGGALVACKGAAGPAGPQGPQGEKGETGAAGSTPELTIGANGNWFADGVDLGVKAPSADAACEEHDFAFVDVVKHTQTEDGIVVKACKTCGFAAITNETLHVMEDGEIPANCLDPKWVGSFCSVCGFKGDGEFVGAPAGHKYTKAQPVTDVENGKYICVDGGMLVQHCTVCFDIQYTTVGAGEYPHTVYNWDVVSLPEEEKFGILFGTCSICNPAADVTENLPVLGSEEYTIKTIKEANCGQDGKYEYTYVDADKNINVTFEVDVPATGHKLKGQNYANYDINNGSYGVDPDEIVVPYWYGEADSIGRLSAIGVKPFAGKQFVCENTDSGYFYCEECKDVVSVKVYYAHNGASEILTAPTCQSTGTKKVDCDKCDYDSLSKDSTDAPIEVKALPHAYLYELVLTGTYKDANGIDWDLYDLVGTCYGNNCDTCGDVKVLASDIYDVDKKELKAPTCLDFGEIKYSFKKVGYSITYSEVVTVPKTNHVLNGEPVKSYEGYTTADPGIKAFVNASFKAAQCGAMVDAYFICEYCSTIPGVDSVVSMSVKKSHTMKDVEVVTAPTCDTIGQKSFICTEENCNVAAGTVIYEDIPALGHSYEYNIVDHCQGMSDDQIENFINYYGYRYEITKVCTREIDDVVCGAYDATFGTMYTKELKKIAESKATCYSEGFVLYNAKIGGEWVELKVVYAKTNHTLAGLIVGSEKFNAQYVNPANGAIYSTTPGIKVFANTKLVCDTVVEGYYECEVCSKLDGVEALVNGVTVYKAHVVKEIIDPADCVNQGAATCANCDINSFAIPALGHDYDLDYVVDGLTVQFTDKSKCTRPGCEETFTETFYLKVPTKNNIKDYYGKGVVTQKADCLNPEMTKYVARFNKDGDLLKLNDNESIVFATVEFEYQSAPRLYHDFIDAQILVVEADEIIDEITEETAKFYYYVVVCDRCGYYQTALRADAELQAEILALDVEEYADFVDYLESIANVHR